MAGGDQARRVAQFLALSSALALGCARPHFPGYVIEPIEPETPPGEELALPTPDSSDPNRRCSRILAVEVRKSERSLTAQCADGEPIRFRAALGRDPSGPKERRGDMKTPEGMYRVAGPPRASRFYLFLPIDYPGEHDAERAVELGLISKAERDEIVAARSAERLPPQGTGLGGNLGIHGEGPRWQGDSQGLNWTYGCVGLADRDVEFLATRVSTGTPVIILP
jgi:murein L,D-transpeptidase YafK